MYATPHCQLPPQPHAFLQLAACRARSCEPLTPPCRARCAPLPSCSVYERGISLFKYPHVKDIWTTYLTQVSQGGSSCHGGGSGGGSDGSSGLGGLRLAGPDVQPMRL